MYSIWRGMIVEIIWFPHVSGFIFIYTVRRSGCGGIFCISGVVGMIGRMDRSRKSWGMFAGDRKAEHIKETHFDIGILTFRDCLLCDGGWLSRHCRQKNEWRVWFRYNESLNLLWTVWQGVVVERLWTEKFVRLFCLALDIWHFVVA